MAEETVPQINITDKDAWDDSSLIKHWDAAFSEYKKYHSLEVTEESEIPGKTGDIPMKDSEKVEDYNEVIEDSIEVDREEEEEDAVPTRQPPSDPAEVSLNNLDDGVKQLVMAWYWAGYYHGLEVGKKSQ